MGTPKVNKFKLFGSLQQLENFDFCLGFVGMVEVSFNCRWNGGIFNDCLNIDWILSEYPWKLWNSRGIFIAMRNLDGIFVEMVDCSMNYCETWVIYRGICVAMVEIALHMNGNRWNFLDFSVNAEILKKFGSEMFDFSENFIGNGSMKKFNLQRIVREIIEFAQLFVDVVNFFVGLAWKCWNIQGKPMEMVEFSRNLCRNGGIFNEI